MENSVLFGLSGKLPRNRAAQVIVMIARLPRQNETQDKRWIVP
jgi:hypothetical protein